MKHLVVLLAIAMLAACNIPDVEDIHLAECVRACNGLSQACFDAAEGQFILDQNVQTFVANAEECEANLVECIATCLDAAEAALK